LICLLFRRSYLPFCYLHYAYKFFTSHAVSRRSLPLDAWRSTLSFFRMIFRIILNWQFIYQRAILIRELWRLWS
jgi:hypothetical protein